MQTLQPVKIRTTNSIFYSPPAHSPTILDQDLHRLSVSLLLIWTVYVDPLRIHYLWWWNSTSSIFIFFTHKTGSMYISAGMPGWGQHNLYNYYTTGRYWILALNVPLYKKINVNKKKIGMARKKASTLLAVLSILIGGVFNIGEHFHL